MDCRPVGGDVKKIIEPTLKKKTRQTNLKKMAPRKGLKSTPKKSQKYFGRLIVYFQPLTLIVTGVSIGIVGNSQNRIVHTNFGNSSLNSTTKSDSI